MYTHTQRIPVPRDDDHLYNVIYTGAARFSRTLCFFSPFVFFFFFLFNRRGDTVPLVRIISSRFFFNVVRLQPNFLYRNTHHRDPSLPSRSGTVFRSRRRSGFHAFVKHTHTRTRLAYARNAAHLGIDFRAHII